MRERPRIVYAGQDHRLQTELCVWLEPDGYELEWVDDAGRLLRAHEGDWHWLLLFDADLTEPENLEVLRGFKTIYPAIPVIVLTSETSLTNAGLARIEGVEALFFKPLTEFLPLLETIDAAFYRLGRWQDVLIEHAERM